MLNRDAILDALAERLKSLVRSPTEGKSVMVTRRDRAFDIANLPALLVSLDGFEVDELGKWTMDVRVNAMVHVPANEVSPETRLNLVVDEVVAALSWQEGESVTYGGSATTLGGSCASCEVTGRIEMRQGIDGVGEAVIPVEIIAYAVD